MKKPVIFHAVPNLNPKYGGPSRTVVQLADSLADRENYSIKVFSQSHLLEDSSKPLSTKTHNELAKSKSSLLLMAGYPLKQKITSETLKDRPAVIHSHGLWHPSNHWIAVTAKKYNIPLITQPRGMLEPWSLNHHSFKKKLALMAYQSSDLKNAKILIATSRSEYQNFRNFGLNQPIAIIPYGISLPQFNITKNASENRIRTLLFISRFHEKKGLVQLIEAWRMLDVSGWRLVLAGPDDRGYKSYINQMVKKYNLKNSVEVLDNVNDYEKACLFCSADLFVLPSHSENFGLVVAEALFYGLPVITTFGTPWEDLIKYDCGWWINLDIQTLKDVIFNAMQLTDLQRQSMGENGKIYIHRYNWARIAQMTEKVYDWIIFGGNPPENIQLN